MSRSFFSRRGGIMPPKVDIDVDLDLSREDLTDLGNRIRRVLEQE